MDTSDRLPFVVHLDAHDAPGDVIDGLTLGEFVAGAQPWARSSHLRQVRPDASLLPDGVTPARSARDSWRRVDVAFGDGWTVRSTRWRNREAVVTVTAVSDELAKSILERATDGAVEPADPTKRQVTIGFWHRTGRSVRRVTRRVEVIPWSEMRSNYTHTTAIALDRLVALRPENLGGRLLLLHGPPGTGKTTALRAVAQAWRGWCQVDFVLDPEKLLGDASYLSDLLLGDGDDDSPERWRLLVMEDCDELLAADAKQETGQSMSRLLNLTDGMVGQGLKVLVCLTTNEKLARLHPAVTRPGRCLGQIHVGPLTRAEAREWLGFDDPELAADVTLAELFELRGTLETIELTAPVAVVGQYL